MSIINEMLGGSNPAKDCTATAKDILAGKTAAVGKEVVTGEMVDNGDVSTAIQNGVLLEGFTSGGTIANLEEGNIKDGVTIAGKTGTYAGAGIQYGQINATRLSTVTINHSLGRVPLFVGITRANPLTSTNTGLLTTLCMNHPSQSVELAYARGTSGKVGSADITTDISCTFSDTKVTVSRQDGYKDSLYFNGILYYVIG